MAQTKYQQKKLIICLSYCFAKFKRKCRSVVRMWEAVVSLGESQRAGRKFFLSSGNRLDADAGWMEIQNRRIPHKERAHTNFCPIIRKKKPSDSMSILTPPHRASDEGQFRKYFFAFFSALLHWYQIFRCVGTGLTMFWTTVTKKDKNMEIFQK